ncbi:hypothetical protein M988_3042 [Hafnia paralvei ATCC 29927]|nr:hypothetical protein M988_3042 [Hafnia paralvei ATCC 29927]
MLLLLLLLLLSRLVFNVEIFRFYIPHNMRFDFWLFLFAHIKNSYVVVDVCA